MSNVKNEPKYTHTPMAGNNAGLGDAATDKEQPIGFHRLLG